MTTPASPFHPGRRTFMGLSAAAFATVAAACGSGDSAEEIDVDAQNVGAMEDYTAGTQFRATEPLEVSVLWTDWPENPVKDSWEFFDKIKELTNVEITRTHVPFSDNVEKRSLLISAGDAPTLIPLMYSGDDTPFVSSGAILPLSDYVEHMPHFRQSVEDWQLEDLIDNLKQADGKYYMLPGLQEISVPSFSLIIRRDVWDEVGVGVPDTWDDVRTGLEAIKEKYPDSQPLADGFEGFSLLNYAAHAFGTRAGWGFGNGLISADGTTLQYAAITDEYKELVDFFRGLVEDGLLDQESLTASNDGSGAAGVDEKFAQDRCFAASGSNGTVIEFVQALNQTKGEGSFEVQQIPPPAGPAGDNIEPRGLWHGFVLNSQIASSENFLAILQFLDWLYFSPDARDLLRWGVEGETYTKDGDDYELVEGYSLEDFDLAVGAEVDIQKDLGYSNFLAESTESRVLKESYNTELYSEYVESVLSERVPRDPFPPAPLDETELERASLLRTPLQDMVDTNTLRFITGDRSMDEWDTYVGELEAGGLGDYLELMGQARERFLETND